MDSRSQQNAANQSRHRRGQAAAKNPNMSTCSFGSVSQRRYLDAGHGGGSLLVKVSTFDMQKKTNHALKYMTKLIKLSFDLQDGYK